MTAVANLQSLDIVIGMVIVFLTTSLLCSAMNELLASALELRATMLQGALVSLLGSDLAKKVLEQPAIPAAPRSDDTKMPAYIEPALFASALLDTILPVPAATDCVPVAPAPNAVPPVGAPSQQFVDAHAAITQPAGLLAESPAQKSLAALVRTAHGDYVKLNAEIANWFDAYMARVSGEYKRRSQLTIVIIAICVAAILNIDSFKIYKQLTTQPAFAAALAAKAQTVVANANPSAAAAPGFGGAVDAVNTRIAALPVPIGWHHDDAPSVTPWWQKVIGLLITALAASLGAPFWFDALNKLANLRAVGEKPGGS